MIGADRFRADSPETPLCARRSRRAGRAGVRMLGYRDHPEVMPRSPRAAIAVVPSRWAEPFGLAALEAMACGAALICSAAAGCRRSRATPRVFVDPDDPAALASAIVALARDPARRAALADAGRPCSAVRPARQRRSGWPSCARELLVPRGGRRPRPALYTARQMESEQGRWRT